MLLRKQVNPNLVLRVGLIALIVANVTQFLLQRTHVASDTADPLAGFLFGLAIGCLLLAIYMKRKGISPR